MNLGKRNMDKRYTIEINKKMNIRISKNILSIVGLAFMLYATGCSAPKNVAYFQDMTEEVIKVTEPHQIKIEPNDKLQIVVSSIDPSISDMFNLPIVTDRVGDNLASMGTGNLHAKGASEGLANYTVNPEGYIDFPVLGMLKVSGLTRTELSYFIKGELMGKELVKDPVVTVEFVNMGVSILGEVARPGRYDINQDQITILQALTMAGDLTIQGKRENVALIREEDNGIKTYRVDLTNFQDLANSPAYYLKQGDLIYVEPNNVRKRQTTANGNNVLSTGFWISVASLLTSVLTTVAVFIR